MSIEPVPLGELWVSAALSVTIGVVVVATECGTTHARPAPWSCVSGPSVDVERSPSTTAGADRDTGVR